MYYLTLLKLLDVCMWIFVYILFWQFTHVVSKVEKLHTKYLFTKRTKLLFLSCSFPVLFVSVCIILFFVVVFLFSTCSIPACSFDFHFVFVCVNTSLQQSTYIMFISHIVGIDKLHYKHVPIIHFKIFVGFKFLYTCFDYPRIGSF